VQVFQLLRGISESRNSQTDSPWPLCILRLLRARGINHVVEQPHATCVVKPYDIDMERVIVAARSRRDPIWKSKQPDRLDLNDMHIHAAKQHSVKFAISTDALLCGCLQSHCYARCGRASPSRDAP
jgi:histidinol phosphatase-like PHP family hydrolase